MKSLLLAGLSLPWTACVAPVPVRIVPGEGITRAGRPYFVKGAGGTERMEELRKRGGNSVRTWSADGLGATLRRARSRSETRAAITQLLRMDDHVLRDIGLTRADAVLILRDPDALPDRSRLRRG